LDKRKEQAVKIKSSRGFTVLEMMIVIAIIAIAASVAAPNFNSFRQNTNLKEAARDISSDISLYKQRAVAENRAYRINFSAAANTYTIQQETVVNNARTGNYVVLTTKTVGAGNANIVILGTPGFDLGVTYVQLDPRGTTSTTCTNNCTVTLQHTKRLSTATITTNLMGRVNVQYVLQK
jgi:prepilin-type N-terminal cleavage/methylation domain-containing protein